MRYSFGKIVVIALGGSVMYPDSIDVEFLKEWKKFVRFFIKRGKRLVIVAGGGRVSRIYQEAAGKLANVSDEDKDWIGIHATRTNAHLLRIILREYADPVVIDEREKLKKLKYPVTIASGWRPGWSTDYIAVALAQDFRVPEVVIAGKPAHVYDKDHAMHRDAKPFHELTWKKYRALIPKKWKPGAHAPVDPVAARLAEKEGISAIIIGGKNLNNFAQLLLGKECSGTLID